MRNFYVSYPNFPDAAGKLTWSRYCELLSVSDQTARNYYEKECVNSDWSVRELKRQINTSLFERLLLSDGIFASRYTYYIPDKEQLIHEVKMLLESENIENDL